MHIAGVRSHALVWFGEYSSRIPVAFGMHPIPTTRLSSPSRLTMSMILGARTTIRLAFTGAVTRRPRSSTTVTVGPLEWGVDGRSSKYVAVTATAAPATTRRATANTAGAIVRAGAGRASDGEFNVISFETNSVYIRVVRPGGAGAGGRRTKD